MSWLLKLRASPDAQRSQQELVSKYRSIESTLGVLLVYIEVNLAATRKILKKLEKKVPGELRLHSTNEYRRHHKLLDAPLQDVLITVRQIKELIAAHCGQAAGALPNMTIDVECQQILLATRGSLEDLQPAASLGIDVYAKPPSADATLQAERARLHLAASSAPDAKESAAPVRGPAHAVSRQAAAAVVQAADFFQGPPSAQGHAQRGAQRPGQPGQGWQSQDRNVQRRGGRGSGQQGGANRANAKGRRAPAPPPAMSQGKGMMSLGGAHQHQGMPRGYCEGQPQAWYGGAQASGQVPFYWQIPVMAVGPMPGGPNQRVLPEGMSMPQGGLPIQHVDPRWLAAMSQMQSMRMQTNGGPACAGGQLMQTNGGERQDNAESLQNVILQ